MKNYALFFVAALMLVLTSCDKYSAAELDSVQPKWIQYDNRPIVIPASPYLTYDYVDSNFSFNSFGTADDTTMLVISNPMNIPFSFNYADYPAPYGTEASLYNSGMNFYTTAWAPVDRQNMTNNGDTIIAVLSPGTDFEIGDIRKINFDIKYDGKLIRKLSYTFTRQF